jgi:hypothetical protein
MAAIGYLPHHYRVRNSQKVDGANEESPLPKENCSRFFGATTIFKFVGYESLSY